MNNEHVNEILQISKLTDAINEKRKDEKTKRTMRIVLICLGALALIGCGAYIACKVCKCKGRRCGMEYDLYDDLDEYYEEDAEDETDEETEAEPEAEAEAAEEEPAEEEPAE